MTDCQGWGYHLKVFLSHYKDDHDSSSNFCQFSSLSLQHPHFAYDENLIVKIVSDRIVHYFYQTKGKSFETIQI